MIRATPTDRPAIETFLMDRAETSMFALSNLRSHGMAGGHPRAMTFWLWWKDGALTDVLGFSEEGLVFPQCPNGPWGEAAVLLVGKTVLGVLGHGGQVAALRRFLGLADRPAAIDHVEPLYQLSLTDLVLPDVAGFALRPLDHAPHQLLVDWRAAYLTEVLPMPGRDVDATAQSDIAGYLEADSHRVLYDGDQPVAMTGFNAVLPEVVQIGGVYTPSDRRGQGHARRVVALHLAQARAQGVAKAILFAANPQAARAYEAIGFTRIGQYTILMYEDPQVIHG